MKQSTVFDLRSVIRRPPSPPESSIGSLSLDLTLELLQEVISPDLAQINCLCSTCRNECHIGNTDDVQDQAQILGCDVSIADWGTFGVNAPGSHKHSIPLEFQWALTRIVHVMDLVGHYLQPLR